jgi:hypothetical protein
MCDTLYYANDTDFEPVAGMSEVCTLCIIIMLRAHFISKELSDDLNLCMRTYCNGTVRKLYRVSNAKYVSKVETYLFEKSDSQLSL